MTRRELLSLQKHYEGLIQEANSSAERETLANRKAFVSNLLQLEQDLEEAKGETPHNLIGELREETGASWNDSRQALFEADNDFGIAVTALHERGQAMKYR